MNEAHDLPVGDLTWLSPARADNTPEETSSISAAGEAMKPGSTSEEEKPSQQEGALLPSSEPGERNSLSQKLKASLLPLWEKIGGLFPSHSSESSVPSPGEISGKNKGNAFTKIFNPDHPEAISEENLIENIISQKSEKSEPGEERSDRRTIFGLKADQEAKELLSAEEEKKTRAEEWWQIAKVALGSSVLIPLTSLLVSALFLSTTGPFARILENQNYGLTLAKRQLELDQMSSNIAQKKQTATEFSQKIADIQNNKVLHSIVTHRIDWKQVFETINDITDRAFEGNSISRYVTYTSYSGKSETGTISIVGRVREPTGKSFAALIRLKDALNAYPNFDGVKINQFVKEPAQTGSKVVTSEYISPFSFQMQYLPTPEAPAEGQK